MTRKDKIFKFFKSSFLLTVRGSWVYYTWIGFLFLLMGLGLWAYTNQVARGLVTTNMKDSVSWGFYIANFTFLVGVADAAVLLVIPAFVYNWKPIREVFMLAVALAVSAIIMSILFVMVDLGKPFKVWHMIPMIGKLNFPRSILAWDGIFLNLYLIINVLIMAYLLYGAFMGGEYNRKYLFPLILFSLPMGLFVHMITAFLYNGLAARPFWNTSLLMPKFLASAFCSGPAILVIVLQILKKTSKLEIKEEAFWKIAELMAYAAFLNLLLLGAEFFKEFYSDTHHHLHSHYMYFGLKGHNAIVPYVWLSVFFNVIGFLLLLIPATRRNIITLNMGCLVIYTAVYIEKGVGLLMPGYAPNPLGEVIEYTPNLHEMMLSAGIFAVGFLIFTILVKIAIPMSMGKVTVDTV